MRRWLAPLLLLAFGCAADPRPNVLLISIDTLRPDHLGCYGYERLTSPSLDRVAASGVVFERALANSPWTLPSHASMLTGRYVGGHGVRDHGHRLGVEVPTLAQMLVQAGYETGAVVNSPNLLPKTDLVRGTRFYRYLDIWNDEGVQVLSADRAVDEAVRWLSTRENERPFFLLLHTYDVHSSYQPAPEYRARFVRPYDGPIDGHTATLRRVRDGTLDASEADMAHVIDLYDGAIRQLDDRLSPLFEYLEETGLWDSTLLIVTSDHGEEFLEHGSVLHGRTLYEEVLRIPLLIRGPGIPAGRRVSEPVELVDVVPTILARLRLKATQPIDGRDLAPLWSVESPSAQPRLAFSEAAPRKLQPEETQHLVAARGKRYKLIHDLREGESQLYDLEADPGETRNIVAEDPVLAEYLLRQIRSHNARGEARAETIIPLSREEIDQLESLGYVN